jgi:RNA polymerase sigma-70 factor (ECF subfamily)
VDDLARLMRRYQAGDAAAFHELFHAVSARLYRYLDMSDGEGMAEDLLQQTWLHVHRARRTYDPTRPVLPWLFAIARNVRRHAFRERARARRRENEAATKRALVPPSAVSVEEQLAVREALDRLPAAQREVVLLTKFADLSVEETAAVLGLTAGAVKQKAHRAYGKLRIELAPGDPAPEVAAGAAVLPTKTR